MEGVGQGESEGERWGGERKERPRVSKVQEKSRGEEQRRRAHMCGGGRGEGSGGEGQARQSGKR
jgi:hypothetical protein|tara:strand:- start:953 stop:1144 length:192 start_codon:yes stop_codon:yes gene_type:complete